MVGWLTLQLSGVSFCEPRADSQGRRQQARAAHLGNWPSKGQGWRGFQTQ